MPEGALDDLVKFTTVARFEPHRVIFSKGDAGDCLYGILSGRVRIYSNSAEGAEIMLNVMEEGELFGEIALLDGSTRTASAAAMDRRTCCAFTAPIFCLLSKPTRILFWRC